jgi:hypothetical protein
MIVEKQGVVGPAPEAVRLQRCDRRGLRECLSDEDTLLKEISPVLHAGAGHMRTIRGSGVRVLLPSESVTKASEPHTKTLWRLLRAGAGTEAPPHSEAQARALER